MKWKHIFCAVSSMAVCALCICCVFFSLFHFVFCVSIHRPLLIFPSAFSMRLWIRPKACKTFYNCTVLSMQTQLPNNLTIYSDSSIFSISILCQHSIYGKWYTFIYIFLIKKWVSLYHKTDTQNRWTHKKKFTQNNACSVFNRVYASFA